MFTLSTRPLKILMKTTFYIIFIYYTYYNWQTKSSAMLNILGGEHGPALEKLGGGDPDFAAFGCEFEGPYPPLAVFDSFP